MGLNLTNLDLTNATLNGNVELLTAKGTLPQRLGIEKLIQIYKYPAGYMNEFKVLYDAYDNCIWVNKWGIGSYIQTVLRKIDMNTMEVIGSNAGNQWANQTIVATDANYLYLEYASRLEKYRKSDFGLEASCDFQLGASGFIQGSGYFLDNYYYRPHRIYDGGWYVRVNKINLDTMLVEEDFGARNISVINESIFTDDHENFYFIVNYYGTRFYHYIKSSDTASYISKSGAELSTVQGGIYLGCYFLGSLSAGDLMAVSSSGLGIRFLRSDGTNLEVCRYIGKLYGDIYNYINSFVITPNYYFISVFNSYADTTDGNIIRIKRADNTFTNSYAEWDVSNISRIRKIIVNGGFSRGYGDSYAEGKQIQVEYWNGSSWIEYDIDAIPDISEDVKKIRIGLQDRYLGNDRLPYVSGISVLNEPVPDVGVRSFEVIDTTKQVEVLDLTKKLEVIEL